MPRSRAVLRAVVTGVALFASAGGAADAPTLWTSAQVEWAEVAEPAGGRQALLWKDAATGDKGTLNSWKFNTRNPPRTSDRDTHFVVLAGTFTVDLDGAEQKQFGPGGFVSIPRGTRYAPGCEAVGECIFVMHEPPRGANSQ